MCAVLAAPACTRTSDGVPLAGDDTGRSAQPTTEETPYPGVVPTPAPAGAPCAPATLPPVRVVAKVNDPAAPTATIGVPDGWSMSSGDGDVEGAHVEGPDGMEAVVVIQPAVPDPETAFREWVDFLTEGATVSTVSTLPGELCGYSGQELMGNLADDTQSVEYRDRVVHVGTAGQSYLIVVHAEAPAGTPGFEQAATLLTGDFEIGLP
ncbi:hypothetical protein C6A85_95670 [Mycobacterium sp. ITM-2017-0098]|nr:hypothetical protein C6A85_95670 [Mycobacterium sp. ITM-2017-0098]